MLDKKHSGFTLIELLIVVAIVGILSAIAVPNFLSARTRATIARVEADLDAVAKAALTFRLDTNAFPSASDDIGETYVAENVDPGDADEFITFQTNNAGLFVTHLTSPIAYIAQMPLDPFSKDPVLPYGYAGGKSGFILTSFGPDRDQHEGVNDFRHRGDIDEPTSYLRSGGESGYKDLLGGFLGTNNRSESVLTLQRYLKPRTYQASNGVISNGDLWRSNL